MNKRPYFLSTMFITFLITTPTLSSMSQESQSVANDISFNAIPDEILSRIFSFALKNNQDNPKTMPELRREIQNIKLVCKRWNLWLDDVLPSVLLSPGTVPGYEGNNETGYSAPTVQENASSYFDNLTRFLKIKKLSHYLVKNPISDPLFTDLFDHLNRYDPSRSQEKDQEFITSTVKNRSLKKLLTEEQRAPINEDIRNLFNEELILKLEGDKPLLGIVLNNLVKKYGYTTLTYAHLDTLAMAIPQHVILAYAIDSLHRGPRESYNDTVETNLSGFDSYTNFLPQQERSRFIEQLREHVQAITLFEKIARGTPYFVDHLTKKLQLPNSLKIVLSCDYHQKFHDIYPLAFLILATQHNLLPYFYMSISWKYASMHEPLSRSLDSDRLSAISEIKRSQAILERLFMHILECSTDEQRPLTLIAGNNMLHYLSMQECDEHECQLGCEALSFVYQKLNTKININQRNEHGFTPLMVAVITKKPVAFLNHLISLGADKEMIDTHGRTALDLARIVKHTQAETCV